VTQPPPYQDFFAAPAGAGRMRGSIADIIASYVDGFAARCELSAGTQATRRRIRPPDGLRTRAAGAASVERGSTAQAMAILGLPPRTIQDRAARGKIPGAAKLGRRWTFDLKELRRFVKQKERETWASARRPQDVFGVARPFGAASRFAAENSDGRFTQVTRRLRGRNSRPRGSG
jgi:Helix-turn-helix domain